MYGDERTYDYVIAFRAITTTYVMTTEIAELPWEVLGKVSSELLMKLRALIGYFMIVLESHRLRLSLNRKKPGPSKTYKIGICGISLCCLVFFRYYADIYTMNKKTLFFMQIIDFIFEILFGRA